MQFFDFNIPYTELHPAEKTSQEKSVRKRNRLKLIVKAMELGYAGVAYNRTMQGLMSESDRCSISLFPLSSLLALSPSLSSAALFHRRLLGSRADSPFRQYTRLTVSVDTPGQASALNSANAILKTYDLVAARPMNQNAFDQVCQFTERGVYFEITYSGLLDDLQVRRQLISNAKLLVDWTRGKNLIVSSAAPSVLDFRGPNDVANLLSLLGLATEHAKAATSKNCRSLIANALKKKQFYKEAIKVELMPSGAQSDPKRPWINIHSLDWDPISSGKGDLLLDDLAKSFSEAGKVLKPAKAIDFDLIMSSMDPNGLKIKDLRPGVEDKSCPSNSAFDIVASAAISVVSSQAEKASFSPEKEPVPSYNVGEVYQRNVSDNSQNSFFSESVKVFTSFEATGSSASASTSKVKYSRDSNESILPSGKQDWRIQNHVSSLQIDEQNTDNTEKSAMDVALDGGQFDDSEVRVASQSKDLNPCSLEPPMAMTIDDDNADTDVRLVSPSHLTEDPLGTKECEETNVTKTSLLADRALNVDVGDKKKAIGDLLIRNPEWFKELPAEEKRQKEDECGEQEADIHVACIAHGVLQMDSLDNEKGIENLVVQNPSTSGEVMLEGLVEGEKRAKTNHSLKGGSNSSKSAKDKLKRRGMRSPFMKHLLQVPFKRKVAASRLKIKKR